MINFETVYLAADRLWRKDIDPTNREETDRHHELIIGLVEACGWTTEDFSRAMMERANGLVN